MRAIISRLIVIAGVVTGLTVLAAPAFAADSTPATAQTSDGLHINPVPWP